MSDHPDESYIKLKQKIEDFLANDATKKFISNYSDRSKAKADLKKHLLLSLKGNIDDIEKILDGLI